MEIIGITAIILNINKKIKGKNNKKHIIFHCNLLHIKNNY